MSEPALKSPFVYFGGKSAIADRVWDAFGDVANYCEPFFGSGAVLLSRPGWRPDVRLTETVNDADGFLANFWRALSKDPDGVAGYADWPVNESDLEARHLWLVSRRKELTDKLNDPDFYDVKFAGWWAWGINAWIGSGWCSGKGPWVYDEEKKQIARRTDDRDGAKRQRPHLGDDGLGTCQIAHEALTAYLPATAGASACGSRRIAWTSNRGYSNVLARRRGVGGGPDFSVEDLTIGAYHEYPPRNQLARSLRVGDDVAYSILPHRACHLRGGEIMRTIVVKTQLEIDALPPEFPTPYFCDEFRKLIDDKYIAVQVQTCDLYAWDNSPEYPHKIGGRKAMSDKLSFDMTWQGEKLRVSCLYTEAQPGHWSEWDGGTPPEGPEVEDVIIEGKNADETDALCMSDGFWDAVYDAANEAAVEAWEEARAGAAEDAMDKQRERRGI